MPVSVLVQIYVEKGSVVNVGNNPSTDAGTDAGTYLGEGMGSGIDREASRDAGGDISIREHTLAEAVYSVATALISKKDKLPLERRQTPAEVVSEIPEETPAEAADAC